MNSLNLRYSFILILTFYLPLTLAETSKHLTTITAAEPVERVPPKYPSNAVKYRREGWAKASFVIEPDGSVSNVIIIDSSGNIGFENATKKAMEKWKYKPAVENGKPVQQCENSVQMDFKIKGVSGVSRKFYSLYNQAIDALKRQNLGDAELVISKIEQLKEWRMDENTYLALLKAEYAKVNGDKNAELAHLKNVSFTSKLISPQQKFSILTQELSLEIQLNQYANALITYEKLTELTEAKPDMAKFDNIKQQIEQYINSDANIVIAATINDKNFWSYKIARNNFSIINIEGSLHKIDVRCANQRHLYTAEENNVWKIPSAWQGCQIFVYGEKNTSFDLLEQPILANNQLL